MPEPKGSRRGLCRWMRCQMGKAWLGIKGDYDYREWVVGMHRGTRGSGPNPGGYRCAASGRLLPRALQAALGAGQAVGLHSMGAWAPLGRTASAPGRRLSPHQRPGGRPHGSGLNEEKVNSSCLHGSRQRPACHPRPKIQNQHVGAKFCFALDSVGRTHLRVLNSPRQSPR